MKSKKKGKRQKAATEKVIHLSKKLSKRLSRTGSPVPLMGMGASTANPLLESDA